MQKKIFRIVSLVLALMLLVSLIPTSASAVNVANDSEAERITTQIKKLYRQTLYGSGKYSLHGYCGTMVNWHLYLMGITASVNGLDGNTQYDFYNKQEYTSGGYRVRAYSAANYTLEAALNAVTYNGTRDVYNIVVGFDRTNTSAGRRYGHALVIHAILDGQVYFSESFSGTFNGKYYYEGTPIVCSIADFARGYDSWTVFEGIIYFGLKTYTESCTYYPSYLYASVLQDTTIYSVPCTPNVDDRSQAQRVLKAGERIAVSGLYCNTEGQYWYQVEDCELGFIPADSTQVLSLRYDDISISAVGAPTVLRTGKSFDIKGKLKSGFNEITSVRAQIFSYGEDGMQHVMSSSIAVNGNNFSLSGSRLSNQLAFRHLEEGSYRYELAAVVGNHYYEDGCLQTEWKTVKLWTSDFRVNTGTAGSCCVTFDANGGTTDLNAVDVAIGDGLEALPEPVREGYVFDGWYTEDGQLVTEGYTVDGAVTLYAKWTNATDMDGWYTENGVWYYYEDGRALTGFLEIDGIVYHLNEGGYLDTGLLEENGKIYYFHINGAMHYGWLELEGDNYYMKEDGSAATGWFEVDGVLHKFSDKGVLESKTGYTGFDEIPLEYNSSGTFLRFRRKIHNLVVFCFQFRYPLFKSGGYDHLGKVAGATHCPFP